MFLSRLSIALVLSACPLVLAQGVMEMTDRLMAGVKADELKVLALAEQVAARSFFALPCLDKPELSAADVDLLRSCLDEWAAKRAARLAGEAQCSSDDAKRMMEAEKASLLADYVRLSQRCEAWAAGSAKTVTEPLCARFKAMLPDMPSEAERLQQREVIAALVARDCACMSEAQQLLAGVVDLNSADAAAEPLMVLMQQSQNVGIRLGALDGQWMTAEDKSLIAQPFVESDVHARLFAEAQRVKRANCFGSRAMTDVFAKLGIR